MPPNIDHYLAPLVFHGLPTEDAESWFSTLQKYASFKHMTAYNKTPFLPVLLQHAAADWYDMLGDEDKSDWAGLQARFKELFHDSVLLRWMKASFLWGHDQGPRESVDQYVTALQKIARPAGVGDDMLR